LHNRSALRLSKALRRLPGVVVASVPWQVGQAAVLASLTSTNEPEPDLSETDQQDIQQKPTGSEQ
jgi:hypothetical protein